MLHKTEETLDVDHHRYSSIMVSLSAHFHITFINWYFIAEKDVKTNQQYEVMMINAPYINFMTSLSDLRHLIPPSHHDRSRWMFSPVNVYWQRAISMHYDQGT